MKNFLLLCLLIVCNNCWANYYSQKNDVNAFIQHMQVTNQFDADYLLSLFKQANVDQSVIEKISRPYEEKIWGVYKNHFLTKKRIDSGVKFYKAHQDILHKAAQEFGVPINIIIAILGVESDYGELSGKYQVFSTLATLAFEYPRRAEFFRKELEHFLIMTREQNIDPLSPKGSYAGAMGNAQFMPSSFRSYAINYSNSGTTNLNNMTDAIGSVANYFKIHGWQTGQPIAHKAKISGNNYQNFVHQDSKNPKTIYKLPTLIHNGISATEQAVNEQDVNVSFLELDNGNNKKEYWLGRDNFYVITRYNHSTNYAMAIFQLANSLDIAIKKDTKS